MYAGVSPDTVATVLGSDRDRRLQRRSWSLNDTCYSVYAICDLVNTHKTPMTALTLSQPAQDRITMTQPEQYTVSQVSDLLKVSGPSVRRWARSFVNHLSSGATPGSGVERSFSQDDVKVFAYAKSRLDKGVPAKVVEGEIATAVLPTWAEIVGRDRGMTPEDTVATALALTGDRLLDTFTATSSAQERIATTLDALRQATADVDVVQTQVDDLQHQLDDLRRLVEGIAKDVEGLKRHRHRLLTGDILIEGF